MRKNEVSSCDVAPLKQLIMNWTAAGVKFLHEKPELVDNSFLNSGINSNLNGADDHMV